MIQKENKKIRKMLIVTEYAALRAWSASANLIVSSALS